MTGQLFNGGERAGSADNSELAGPRREELLDKGLGN